MTQIASRIRPLSEEPKSASQTVDSLLSPVADDLKEIERRLLFDLPARVESAPEIVSYLVEAGGKRIRPALVCLTARSCGYFGDHHFDLACVSELLHSATLFHDDVVDSSRTRRGRPTANRVFGNKMAVLSGDLMFAYGFGIMMDGEHFRISQALAETVRNMVEGEIRQLKHSANIDMSIHEYLRTIEYKTASLFGWACLAGATVGGGDETTCALLKDFGCAVGMAFQMTDDLLDLCGDADAIGKDTLRDLQEKKVTLPVLLAAEEDPRLTEVWEEFVRSDSGNGKLDELQAQILSTRGPERAHEMAQQFAQRAQDLASRLTPSPYRDSMVGLADFVTSRVS